MKVIVGYVLCILGLVMAIASIPVIAYDANKRSPNWPNGRRLMLGVASFAVGEV